MFEDMTSAMEFILKGQSEQLYGSLFVEYTKDLARQQFMKSKHAHRHGDIHWKRGLICGVEAGPSWSSPLGGMGGPYWRWSG